MKHLVRFAMAAAFALAVAAPVGAADTVNVALNWNVPYSGWAGFYVARAKGYYEAEGLDVKWTLIKGSNPVNQTIAAGNADLGVAAASSLVVAASKGLPLIAVSAFMQSNPEGVIVREDSGEWSVLGPGHHLPPGARLPRGRRERVPRLRQKAAQPKHLVTETAVGYRLVP